MWRKVCPFLLRQRNLSPGTGSSKDTFTQNVSCQSVMLLTRDLVSVLLRAVLVLYPQPPGPGIPQATGQGGSRQAQGCALPMVLT